MATWRLTVVLTITFVLAVLSVITPTEALTEHQLLVLQGAGANGKRSQTGMLPQQYLNLRDGVADSQEFETEPEQNPVLRFLARHSPAVKRHMLSELLDAARMDNELNE